LQKETYNFKEPTNRSHPIMQVGSLNCYVSSGKEPSFSGLFDKRGETHIVGAAQIRLIVLDEFR